MADTALLTKAVDALIDGGVLVKDALNKSLFAVIGDLTTVLGDVSNGFDMPTLLAQLKALDESAWKALMAHIATKLPAVGDAKLQGTITDALNLTHDAVDWIEEGVLLLARGRTLVGI